MHRLSIAAEAITAVTLIDACTKHFLVIQYQLQRRSFLISISCDKIISNCVLT